MESGRRGNLRAVFRLLAPDYSFMPLDSVWHLSFVIWHYSVPACYPRAPCGVVYCSLL